MSSHLQVSQALEFLDRLKVTVREVAASEEKLEQEFRLNRSAALKGFEQAAEDNTARQAAETQQAEEALRGARGQHQARYDRRKHRIQHAHQSGKRRIVERIDNAEDRQKYAAQKGLMDTERQRKENLARNDETRAEFQRQLAENRQEFVAL